MPLYFLIDTNIWVNELADTQHDSLIKQRLEYLTKNDRIRLLASRCPDEGVEKAGSNQVKSQSFQCLTYNICFVHKFVSFTLGERSESGI